MDNICCKCHLDLGWFSCRARAGVPSGTALFYREVSCVNEARSDHGLLMILSRNETGCGYSRHISSCDL